MESGHPVERYYDRNTRRFLFFGGGQAAHAIHRQLWGPGVANVTAAARYINELLADSLGEIARGNRPVIVDLGCGVGGTALHLAHEFPGSSLHGVTISRRQIEIAERAAQQANLSQRVQFHYADFESLNLGVEADALIAVESFTHSRSAQDFFRRAAAHLRPGGRLIIVDDFLTGTEEDLSVKEQRLADDFRAGWQLPGLCTTSDCIAQAKAQGLDVTEDRDLTGLIRLGRPRDRLIRLIAPLARRLGLAGVPFFGNLIGGNALHQGLGRGILAYRWLSFERAARHPPD